jgi:hypothetical protein
MADGDFDIGHRRKVVSLKHSITPNLYKHNRFILVVSRIHTGHKELSNASIDYRKAGLALIEQGISDILCSLDQDLIPWSIFDQIEAFFHYLDMHVTDDIEFRNYEPSAIPDQALDLPAGILDFLDDLLLSADAQAHRFLGSKYYYA